MTTAFLIAARRTAVVPRNGAFSELEAHELAAPVFQALLHDAGIESDVVDSVIMGNALYAGGNPARMASLAAGLPESVAAITIDTQCCSGMDAISLAVSRVENANEDIVIAGGLESWSRAPIRMRRAKMRGEQHTCYERPPFSPWPEGDPDMLDAAASLAVLENVSRREQEYFAQASHARALLSAEMGSNGEIVALNGVLEDAFSRVLSENLLKRLPVICEAGACSLTSATAAVQADAGAAVLVVSEKALPKVLKQGRAVKVCGALSCGSDPKQPALAAAKAVLKLLERLNINIHNISVVELMEAFAVQAIMGYRTLGLDPKKTNRGGGALSRGHPVGASGAINVVRLWHELQKESAGSSGIAGIAAAGGLGTAMVGEIQC